MWLDDLFFACKRSSLSNSAELHSKLKDRKDFLGVCFPDHISLNLCDTVMQGLTLGVNIGFNLGSHYLMRISALGGRRGLRTRLGSRLHLSLVRSHRKRRLSSGGLWCWRRFFRLAASAGDSAGFIYIYINRDEKWMASDSHPLGGR